MKTAFAILMGLHGLIHLMGFLKAFGWGHFPMLTEPMSRTHGLFWLLATLLFLISLTTYLLGQTSWPWIAIGAVILSQVLVMFSWIDAKHGTWLNLVVLVVAVAAIAKNSFDEKVEEEVAGLYEIQGELEKEGTVPEREEKYPAVVERWLRNSGAREFRDISTVYLRQKGKMRIKPDGKWMPFTAEQWFTVKKPGFVWKTRVQMAGSLYLSGRDKFVSGSGAMDISILSLIPVVKASGDPKTDQASGIRYLAEICWFPVAAREPYLIWEAEGTNAARATLKQDPEITGVFTFDEKGNMISFEADRYRDSGENAPLEKWRIRNTSHRDVGGLRIPDKSEVTWDTKEGEFHWLTLEITEIHYN